MVTVELKKPAPLLMVRPLPTAVAVLPITTAPQLVTVPPFIANTFPAALLVPIVSVWAFAFQNVLVRTVRILFEDPLPMMVPVLLVRI